ncbi:hypothetical protein [Microbacterium sp. NPDC076895]|uniref:hypothetical protein n=1 Tax=Microbacterium sp. NPDC076895 TaxID=3154957 RepID=UPI003442AEDF
MTGQAATTQRRRLIGAGMLGAALVLGLAACASAAPSEDLPDGVSVRLVQQRSDVALHQAQVEITNGTDSTLSVEALSVSDPRFESDADRVLQRTSVIAPGSTVGIRIQLPGPACDVPDEAASTVEFSWHAGDRSGVARADLPDALDFLPAMHERECVADALGDAAAVSFTSFEAGAGGGVGILTLGALPTGAGGATIDAIRPTNLLGFGAAGTGADAALPLRVELAAGDTVPRDVEIALEPFRCDAHAVQEDKRGTIFTVDVTVGGEAGQIELAASPDMRAEILNAVAAYCGFGS